MKNERKRVLQQPARVSCLVFGVAVAFVGCRTTDDGGGDAIDAFVDHAIVLSDIRIVDRSQPDTQLPDTQLPDSQQLDAQLPDQQLDVQLPDSAPIDSVPDTKPGALSASDLTWCQGSCGGQWPITLGGWDDDDDLGSWARGPGCAGALQLFAAADNQKTRLCAKQSIGTSLVRICAESCGGATSEKVGGWEDNTDISDVSFGPSCSGVLGIRSATETLVCVAPAVLTHLRLCNVDCGAGTSLGGWSDHTAVWDLSYAQGCTGTLEKRQDQDTLLCFSN